MIGFGAAREATAEDLITFNLVEDNEFGSDAPAPAAENVTLTVQDLDFTTASPKVEV